MQEQGSRLTKRTLASRCLLCELLGAGWTPHAELTGPRPSLPSPAGSVRRRLRRDSDLCRWSVVRSAPLESSSARVTLHSQFFWGTVQSVSAGMDPI